MSRSITLNNNAYGTPFAVDLSFKDLDCLTTHNHVHLNTIHMEHNHSIDGDTILGMTFGMIVGIVINHLLSSLRYRLNMKENDD